MLDTIQLQTEATPDRCLIILHGLGASGEDFVPVVQAMDLAVPRADSGLRVLLPQAPMRAVTLNGGYHMPAWYDIGVDDDGQRFEAEADLREAQGWLDELIHAEEHRGIPAHRIVLMGFSQGAAMTLMTGLRYPERLGGLVALSGYMPLASQAAQERHPANAQTPVFLAHGRLDEVVAPERGLQAKAQLEGWGQPLHWTGYEMGHELCQEEVEDIAAFLQACWREA